MLNEAPNNNNVKRIANIVLNEMPNSNDATGVGNTIREVQRNSAKPLYRA